jgi:hypothetical protein
VTEAQAQIAALRGHGWQQGSVLPPSVVVAAQKKSRWPHHIAVGPDDWLIVVSHACDLRNRKPENEPDVEVLVARPYAGKKADSRETHGKNSRRLHFEGEVSRTTIRLVAHANERFAIDRLLLADAPPDQQRVVGHPGQTPDPTLQVLITWITKRYLRQAFPDEFDQVACQAKQKVDEFLIKHAGEILGVFIAFADRGDRNPRFHLEFRVAIKTKTVVVDWPAQKAALEETFETCWEGVPNVEVEVAAIQASHLSIGEIYEGKFMKFDRDWISYAEDPEGEPAPEA